MLRNRALLRANESCVQRNDSAAPGDERGTERCAEPLAARKIFFRSHDASQHQHPPYAARADDEHQQHQRPAAADAERAVVEPEAQGFTRGRTAAPAGADETERRMT